MKSAEICPSPELKAQIHVVRKTICLQNLVLLDVIGKLYILNSVHSPDDIGCLLGNGDSRRSRVATRNLRHHRCVNDAQTFDAYHPAKCNIENVEHAE